MRRLFQWLSFLCALSLLCGCNANKEPSQPISAHYDDFLHYDEQGLIDVADTIIVGTVTKTEIIYHKSENTPEQLTKGMPGQYSHIKVTRTLRGSVPENNKIVVPLSGDGKTYSVDNIMTVGGYFEKGDRVLLFLKSRSDEYWTSLKENDPKFYRKIKKFKETLSGPCNLYQSTFWLDEEGNILHDRNKSNARLFTDCATMDELVEKYNLN